MERRAPKVGPRRMALAMVATVAFVFLTVGVASAAGASDRSPVMTISSDQVTLGLPSTGCPQRRPVCEWMLFVNEPGTGKLIGVATGPGTATGSTAAAELTVALPADFCGVVQADLLIGPSPWHKVKGRKATVQTSASCSLPFTAAITGTSPRPPEPSQLPFTGIDVKPLTVLGASLTMLGLLMAVDFDKRRTQDHRSNNTQEHRSKELTWSSTADAAGAAARWLLGD